MNQRDYVQQRLRESRTVHYRSSLGFRFNIYIFWREISKTVIYIYYDDIYIYMLEPQRVDQHAPVRCHDQRGEKAQNKTSRDVVDREFILYFLFCSFSSLVQTLLANRFCGGRKPHKW